MWRSLSLVFCHYSNRLQLSGGFVIPGYFFGCVSEENELRYVFGTFGGEVLLL